VTDEPSHLMSIGDLLPILEVVAATRAVGYRGPVCNQRPNRFTMTRANKKRAGLPRAPEWRTFVH